MMKSVRERAVEHAMMMWTSLNAARVRFLWREHFCDGRICDIEHVAYRAVISSGRGGEEDIKEIVFGTFGRKRDRDGKGKYLENPIPLYVCRQSLRLHMCGSVCEYNRSEHSSCPISGETFGEQIVDERWNPTGITAPYLRLEHAQNWRGDGKARRQQSMLLSGWREAYEIAAEICNVMFCREHFEWLYSNYLARKHRLHDLFRRSSARNLLEFHVVNPCYFTWSNSVLLLGEQMLEELAKGYAKEIVQQWCIMLHIASNTLRRLRFRDFCFIIFYLMSDGITFTNWRSLALSHIFPQDRLLKFISPDEWLYGKVYHSQKYARIRSTLKRSTAQLRKEILDKLKSSDALGAKLLSLRDSPPYPEDTYFSSTRK